MCLGRRRSDKIFVEVSKFKLVVNKERDNLSPSFFDTKIRRHIVKKKLHIKYWALVGKLLL